MRTKSWTLPTVLGLILGAVGAGGVIELRPQMEVNPWQIIHKNKPLSIPFHLENTGYLSFYVEHAFCYTDHMRMQSGLSIVQNLVGPPEWEDMVLGNSQSGTINCKTDGMPVSADMAIVVAYRPFRQFPHTFKKYYGFHGIHGDDWQWSPVPISEEMKSRIEGAIKLSPSAGSN